ncbi:cupin domain-containing protein [Peribacillus asahii]|uniref:Cupin domain-containing protein n=2 Tax=Peribacillus asahii TaxID=228899 RepID=A0A398B7E1_9BACI|nr:cupin domain-containing protein [Peribacillus asahii]
MTELELTSHSREECGYVLQAILKVYLGDQQFHLNEGDSISFSSMIPHHYNNLGNDV